MNNLEYENQLLRRYIAALNKSRLNNGGVLLISDEMIENAGRAAIEAAFGQKLTND